jgi:hypothetical protein
MLNPAYKPASMRSVGMPPAHPDVVGLSLSCGTDCPADAMRFHFTREEAERLALALLDAVSIQRYRVAQSSICSGKPNCDGSPQSGHAQ